jgi:hypothetical protein
MSNPLDQWLDADREDGVTVARLTVEQICEAEEYRRLNGGAEQPYVVAVNLLAQRAFEVTALRYTERDVRGYVVLRVVRGSFLLLQVPLHVLAEGDERDDKLSKSWAEGYPHRGAWPTRLFNPMRQNLSFIFEGTLSPCAVEIHWRHVHSALDKFHKEGK